MEMTMMGVNPKRATMVAMAEEIGEADDGTHRYVKAPIK
jgi:hypothetical protein